jgi:hypothetical protein
MWWHSALEKCSSGFLQQRECNANEYTTAAETAMAADVKPGTPRLF